MSKITIPLILSASILILGTFALENPSFAFTNEGDQSMAKVKGIATCDDHGEYCGEGKAMGQFRLLATHHDGDLTKGVAKGVIQGSGWGWLFYDTDIQDVELRNNGPLEYQYDDLNRIIQMSGTFVDQNTGVLYDYDAVGNISDFGKKKAKIELNMSLVDANGIVIDLTGAGIIIDVTGAD